MVTPRATSPRTLHVRNNPVRSPRSSRRLRSQSVDVERCGMGTRDNLVVDFERLDTLQEPNAERGGIWGWSFAVPDMVNGAWKWTKGRARRVQHGYAEFKRSIDGRPVDDGINTVPMRPVLNIEVMNVRAMMVILAVTYFFAIGATVFAFMERGLRVDDSRRFSVSRTQWLECSELPLAELQSRGMHKVVGMFNDTCGSQPSAYAWTQMSTMIAAVELDIALRATPIALSATSHLGSNHTLREAFHLALAVFDDESDEAGRTGLVRDYRATESWEQSLGERGEHCRHKAEDVEGLLRCRTQTLASPKDGFDEVLWQNSLRSRLGDRISDHRKRTRWDIYFVVPVSSIDGVGYDATLHNLDLHVKTQSRDFERAETITRAVICSVTLIVLITWLAVISRFGWRHTMAEHAWLAWLLVGVLVYADPTSLVRAFWPRADLFRLTDSLVAVGTLLVPLYWWMQVDGVQQRKVQTADTHDDLLHYGWSFYLWKAPLFVILLVLGWLPTLLIPVLLGQADEEAEKEAAADSSRTLQFVWTMVWAAFVLLMLFKIWRAKRVLKARRRQQRNLAAASETRLQRLVFTFFVGQTWLVMVVFGVEFLSSVVQTSQGSDDDARGSSHTHPLAAAFLLCVYAWCLSLVMAPLPRGRASRWLQIGSLRSAAVAERRRNLNVRLLHRLVHVSWQAYCHPPAAPDEQHTEWGEIELSPYDLRLTDYEQVDDGKYAWLLAEPTLQDVESASCSSSSGSEFAQSVERQRSNRNNNNNNTRNNNNRNNNTEDEKEEAGELRLQLRRQRSFDGTNEVILAFRGTTSADNLKTDLRFKRRRVHLDFFRTGVDAGELPGEDKDLWDPRQTVRLHSGFFEAWKNVRRSLMPRFERLLDTTPDAIITATGHSMGGVFAVFAVLECCMRLRMPVKSCITFGSPRCGDADFAEFADRTLGKNVHLRVVYRQDTVSHLPFTQLGYMHAGREIVIDRVGNALFDLDLDFGALDRLLAGCRGSLSHHILDNYVDGIEAMKLLMEEQQQDRVRDLLDHLADGRTAGDADYPEDRVAGQSIELTTCSEVPGDDDMDDETRRNRFLTISSPLRHLAHFRPSVRRRLFVDPSLAEEDSEPGSCRTASVSPASCRSGSGTPVEIDLFARPNSDSVGTVVAPASHDVRLSIESQQLDVRFVHGRLPNRRISV